MPMALLPPFSMLVKLGDFTSAVQSFERSLEISKIVKDDFAEAAIKKALDNVNQSIVDNLRPKEETVRGDEPNATDSPMPTKDGEDGELESQDGQEQVNGDSATVKI